MIRLQRPGADVRRDAALRRARRDGSAAVEFGIIAVPFLMMLFAILEIAVIFLTDTVLENAVIDAGRQVRTGEADRTGMNTEKFKTKICANMSAFANNCASRLTVDVQVLTGFRNPPEDPLRTGAFDPAGLDYKQSQPGDIVIVRAWYQQPIFTPFMTQGAPRAGGNGILTATTSFRNEPYNQ